MNIVHGAGGAKPAMTISLIAKWLDHTVLQCLQVYILILKVMILTKILKFKPQKLMSIIEAKLDKFYKY